MEFFKTLDGNTFYKVSDTIGMEVRITDGWERIALLTPESCKWLSNEQFYDKKVTAILPEEFNEAYLKVQTMVNKLLIL